MLLFVRWEYYSRFTALKCFEIDQNRAPYGSEQKQVVVVWKIEFSPSSKAHADIQRRHSSSRIKTQNCGRIFFTSVGLWVSIFSSIYFFMESFHFGKKNYNKQQNSLSTSQLCASRGADRLRHHAISRENKFDRRKVNISFSLFAAPQTPETKTIISNTDTLSSRTNSF